MAASGEKPYRVYRGGRTKGKVPLSRREAREQRDGKRTTRRGGGGGGDGPGRQVVRRPKRRWTWKRTLALTILGLIVLIVVWSAVGYFSVHSGVSKANARLPVGTTSALKKQNGLMLTNASNILLLGTDHADNGQANRSTLQHSDSMMLLRTDPGRHRLIFLSIPRDLRASIPGHGEAKINAAMQIGGPKLAVETADQLFGPALPVNHVVVVDFGAFTKLIDGVGGIDINIPQNILSNRFDCPYSPTRCQNWEGWRFHKGVQHLNGHQALIYSRIRENRLNPADNDITRGERQQAVMQATLSRLASVSTFFRLPFSGGDLLSPISTDLSTSQFIQMAWIKFRAGATMHCRLGGKDLGDGYITGDETNIAVIQMVLGNSAAQPPPPGSGPYGPGCVSGNASLTTHH